MKAIEIMTNRINRFGHRCALVFLNKSYAFNTALIRISLYCTFIMIYSLYLVIFERLMHLIKMRFVRLLAISLCAFYNGVTFFMEIFWGN